MKEKKISIAVSPSIGKVSGKVVEGKKPWCVLCLAHGAGAGMDHPFMKNIAEEYAALGVTTLRYNFPFMETKKGRPDSPAVATKTVEEAATKAHKLFPKLPLFVGGKSFGGRMTSQWVSREQPTFVKGIVFFGFPLHPPGNPSIERADHLREIRLPMLFLQGTRDTLADLKLLKPLCKKLPSSTLITFENADHSFKAGKTNNLPTLTAMSSGWMEGID